MSQLVRSVLKFSIALIVAVAIRLVLFNSSYQVDIADRVEVSTPVSSWKRVTEAVYLSKIGVSPYDGDTFHETPLSLYVYQWLLSNWKNLIPVIFIVVDALTAILLSFSCAQQLQDCSDWENEPLAKLQNKDLIKKLSIDRDDISSLSALVGISYLLLPYTILSCVGLSTSAIYNMMVSLLILSSTKNLRFISMSVAALIAHTTMYGTVLVVPAILTIEHQRSRDPKTGRKVAIDFSRVNHVGSIVTSIASFLTFLGVFAYISSSLVNHSTDWINGTYIFQLSVTDLTPNVGVFWYFFTEMFDHFREFFLWTFQINAFIYTIPLAITLRRNPYIVFFLQLVLLSILKPYPSISDLAIYLPLLVQWSHLSQYLKHSLISGTMLITCSVLAPILWHLWIMLGTANSNFYFGVTLAYNTAQILLVTDYFFAFTKRQFHIDHGQNVDEKTKQPKVLELIYEFSERFIAKQKVS